MPKARNAQGFLIALFLALKCSGSNFVGFGKCLSSIMMPDADIWVAIQWHNKYRVIYLNVDPGWVVFDLGVPPSCPASSAKFLTAQAEPGRWWTDVNEAYPTLCVTTRVTL